MWDRLSLALFFGRCWSFPKIFSFYSHLHFILSLNQALVFHANAGSAKGAVTLQLWPCSPVNEARFTFSTQLSERIICIDSMKKAAICSHEVFHTKHRREWSIYYRQHSHQCFSTAGFSEVNIPENTEAMFLTQFCFIRSLSINTWIRQTDTHTATAGPVQTGESLISLGPWMQHMWLIHDPRCHSTSIQWRTLLQVFNLLSSSGLSGEMVVILCGLPVHKRSEWPINPDRRALYQTAAQVEKRHFHCTHSQLCGLNI